MCVPNEPVAHSYISIDIKKIKTIGASKGTKVGRQIYRWRIGIAESGSGVASRAIRSERTPRRRSNKERR